MGAHSQELLHEVPAGEVASVMADMHLYGRGAVGAQRLAVLRGAVASRTAIENFSLWRGRPRVLTMGDVEAA